MNARQIIEAETPKKALRSTGRGRIKPGRGYWLNIANADQPWSEGESCPAEISSVNVLSTLDGLYGLSDDVTKALEQAEPGFHYATPEGEERFVQEMHKYEEPIWDSVRRGVTSGRINGIDGPKKWQLIFQLDTAPVQPGVDYPTEPCYEAENPKKAMRFMKPLRRIGGEHTDVGALEVVVVLSNNARVTAELPISWTKWDDSVIVNLSYGTQPGLTDEQWHHVVGVIDYGLNEGFNSADHHDFEEPAEHGQIYIDRMYWKITGYYDNDQLRRRAYEKLFPMSNY